MFRFVRYFAGVAIAAIMPSVPLLRSHAGVSTNTVSVIVEFKDDPAAVYAAKLKRSGALPSIPLRSLKPPAFPPPVARVSLMPPSSFTCPC